MGLCFQVSRLCGSKFQAAFQLNKQHFQVPAVSFDSFLLPGSSDIKSYESAHFAMFWDYVPQHKSPASLPSLRLITLTQLCYRITALQLGMLSIQLILPETLGQIGHLLNTIAESLPTHPKRDGQKLLIPVTSRPA